jgi:hypothetical protein
MNKKAIAILGGIFLLIVITLAVLIFQRSKSGDEENTNTPSDTQTNTDDTQNQLPQDEIPNNSDSGFNTGVKAIRLTEDQVVSPVLFYQGNGITYFNKQGQLFQSDLQIGNGVVLLANKKELVIPQKPGGSKVIWPLSGNNFMVQSGSGTSRTWSVYDSLKGGFTDLPSQITSVNWMPTGDRIIYIWLDEEGKSTLSIADPDSTNYTTIADIWENDDELNISPDGRTILFYRLGSTDSRNAINLTTSDGQIFKSVVKEGYNFGVLWAPDSQKFVFGRRDSDGQRYQLWVGDVVSGETKNLGVFTTVDKVVWANNSQKLYAAVPTRGLPDKGLTEDIIYEIDSQTATQKQIEPGLAVDAREMFLNLTNDKLFFKNMQDEGLYYIDVSK